MGVKARDIAIGPQQIDLYPIVSQDTHGCILYEQITLKRRASCLTG